MLRKSFILITSLFISACSQWVQSDMTHNDSDMISSERHYCSEPRPTKCTREYRPVCATLNDDSIKTYSTGCVACADPSVVSYVAGSCEGGKKMLKE